MSATLTTLTDKLNAIKSIKDSIQRAIDKKGVTVDGAFSTYPECIISIETGGGDELAKGLIERTATEVNIPDGTTSIGQSAFMNYIMMRSVTIPDSVTSIGNSAFNGCSSLTSATIPNGVTLIGESAFNTCSSLTSITIPDGVTSIRPYTFASCTGLTSVTLPKYLTSIGDDAFEACSSLTSVTIPDSVTSIRNYAFASCTGLTSVTIPSGVTSIGSSAFNGCSSLISVNIPDSVTMLGDAAFYSCHALTSVTIPSGITSIGNDSFAGCSALTSVTIPDSVTSIGDYAFYNCGFSSVTIPSNVTVIGGNAFASCSALTSVTIPSGVTSIYGNAFNSCTSLASVTIENSEAKLQYGNESFSNIASNAILYVPEALLSDYQADSHWTGAFSQIRAIGSEPAAYTITGVSTDQGNVDYKEWSMLYGETGELPVTFFGTGLTNELDWTNIVNVEYDTGYFSDINFIGVNDVAEDGTWATINYGYTVVNTESGRLTSWPSEIHFTCGEYSGTINACVFKVHSYEWDSDNTDTVNNYPNTINATAIVNLGNNGSITDHYLNDDAKTRLTSIIQSPVEWNVTSIDGDVHMIDEFEGEYHVTLHCTLTPEDANSLTVSLQWEGMDAVEHTFATPVHIEKFEVNDAIAVNGDDWVHLTKNENNAFVLPQVGPSILLPLSELNDGVNMWDDTVTCSVLHEGANVVLLNDSTTLEPWEENGTLYQCVRINTNNISREQLFNVWSDAASALPLKITVEINGVSQDLNVALGATDMALPTGCTQITAGISNKFSDNDIDKYRFINTSISPTTITPTTDTIVKAELGLQATYGNCLVGYQTSDDVTDWRLFAQGSIENQTDPWAIYFDYGPNDDAATYEHGNRISVEVARTNIVDENNNPKRLKFTMSNGKLEILDSNNTQIVSTTGPEWNGQEADNMRPICIWQPGQHNGSWDIDIATLYDVQIYGSQTGVERNAPLMHVIPVTVNDETQLFDMVTRQYLDIQTFEPEESE